MIKLKKIQTEPPGEKKPMTAVGYGRRSSSSQKDNTSKEAQIRSITDYCAQSDLSLVADVCFDELTGTNWDRPCLWRAMSLMRCLKCFPPAMPDRVLIEVDFLENCPCGKNAGADVLVISNLNRFGRNSREIMFLASDVLAKRGKYLVATMGETKFDTRTPMGAFILTMFAGLAQLDRDELVEKWDRGKIIARQNLRYAGGGTPYGWQTDGARKGGSGFKHVPGQMQYVYYVFYLAALGKTQRQIADALNTQNILTARGGHWHQTSIFRILSPGEHEVINAEKLRIATYCRRLIKWAPNGGKRLTRMEDPASVQAS